MRQLLTLALLATAGCATTGAVAHRTDAYDNATVTGVVALPADSASPKSCQDLAIAARSAGGAMGKVTVRESRNRCAYEISRLPVGTDLSITVTPPEAWKCGNGASAAFTPASVRLEDHQTLTHDFKPLCQQQS